jgi:hypothetical protein
MPPPTIVNVLTVEVYFGGILQKNSMKERIKELFLALKKKRLLNKMNRINPNPAEYKKWEHHTWGNSIEICRINKNTFSIRGWLQNKPENGDKLIYETESGKYAVGYIVDVEYCGDPRDMFFANVIPFEYLKHQ